MSVCLVQAMCALLQCAPVFDRNGLITGGYLYNWLQLVLNSPKEKVSLVTVAALVFLNEWRLSTERPISCPNQ